MGSKSGIEWTKATWNPLTGCTKISPGCKNCYAERMSFRLKAKQLVVGNAYGFDVVLHIAADDTVYLNKALLEFAKVPGVTGVTLLATRCQP
jgi:hypothetical protein